MEQVFGQKSRNKEIGKLGEDLSVKFLVGKGFKIISRNYLKKWGEIDIVSRETNGKLHFVEVKTVSYETRSQLKQAVKNKTWRPEENVHYAKIQRLNRAIESWLLENQISEDWQIDVLAVRIVPDEKFATVKFIPNIIFD